MFLEQEQTVLFSDFLDGPGRKKFMGKMKY
jgi:hypothetical protein